MVLFLLSSTLVTRWVIFQVFIHTEWFTGPQQFALQQLIYFVFDLYLIIYCPYKWIKRSVANNWAGWTRISTKRRVNYFYFIREPDPREELRMKGYFQNVDDCSNIRRHKTNKVDIRNEIENYRRQIGPPIIQCLSSPAGSTFLPSLMGPSNPTTHLSMSSLPNHSTVSREYFLRERREKEQMKMEMNC